jgi:multidrug efflux pump
MFFVVIRAKFGGETEDVDEAARLAEAHHSAPHAPNAGENKNGDEGH